MHSDNMFKTRHFKDRLKPVKHDFRSSLGYANWNTVSVRYHVQNEYIRTLLRTVEQDMASFMTWLYETTDSVDIRNRIGKPLALSHPPHVFSKNHKPYGNGGRFICPYHKERTASFVYYNNSGNFYCHGCGRVVNTIGLTMDILHLKLSETLWLLSHKYHLGRPPIGLPSIKRNHGRIWLDQISP